MKPMVNIFSDGGCRNNGKENNVGGWGTILKCNGNVKEISGGATNTSNNQMELTGAIAGLRALLFPCQVTLTTDSKYVCDGMSSWIKGWKAKGWKTANKQPVKNKELWQQLDSLCQVHDVQFIWVKGHDGHEENERCDELANIEMDKIEGGN